MPTAAFAVVDTVDEGLAAVSGYPTVIKADGLAAGKGVVIAEDEGQARAALEAMLVDRRFGDAPVVVEEFLAGRELSLLALCDGETALPLAPARDFKRIGDGDTGPNTGGMGSFSPVAGVDDALVERIRAQVHQPVVDELAARGTPFHGVLYAGLMLDGDDVGVLEFNVRFGDPETQAVLPRLRSDLLDLLERATRPGGLAGARLEWDARAAVTVVLASRGYPETASSGDVITGLDRVPDGRRGHPRGHARARRRRGHRGRPGAERDRARRRHAIRPRARVCCGRRDRVRGPAAAPGHRRMSEPAVAPSVEAEFEGLEVDTPLVGIVMGSKSDMPAMDAAASELTERGIRHEVRVMSAHREPDTVAEYAKNAQMRGLRVIIAGAGLSAALPGVVAAHTTLPVIGVPLTSSKSVAGGLDALLSIAQMPPGVPVACVGVDNARNAAVLAARILDS